MDFKTFNEILSKYGVEGIITFLLFLVAISFLKSNWLSSKWDKIIESVMSKFKKKEIKKEIDISHISNHDIFNYIDFWVNSTIPTYKFSTEYRTIIFRKYLTIYLKSYRLELHDLIQNREFEDWDRSELWKNMLNLINKIVHDYEAEMVPSGIPSIIISKMKSKNNDTILLMIDLIENICNSEFYSSDKNLLKIYSILNIILSILENTISSSEEVCDSINGELKGLVVIKGNKTIKEP